MTIGIAQALALFPGISRSGITIATGLFLGLEREAAARFSFLMAVPVIAGAGPVEGSDADRRRPRRRPRSASSSSASSPSAIFGFIAIAFLLRFLRTNPTTIFVAYRVVLAAVIVVAWLGLWDR